MLYIIDVAPRDPGFITMKGVRIIKKRDIEAGWVAL
jgi:precorrin-2 methylase